MVPAMPPKRMAASFRSRRSVHRALAMVILMFGALADTWTTQWMDGVGFGSRRSFQNGEMFGMLIPHVTMTIYLRYLRYLRCLS